MKSSRECPPPPTGEISFCTGKPRVGFKPPPPAPPPMRQIKDDGSFMLTGVLMQIGLVLAIAMMIKDLLQ